MTERVGQYLPGQPLDGIPRPPYGHGDKPYPYPDPWGPQPDGSVVSAKEGGGPNARVSGAAVPNGVLPIVYGRGRVEGTIFHYTRDGNGGTFYVWICGGPIQEVVKAYNNGVEVPGTWSIEYSLGPEVPASTPAYIWTFTQRFPFVCWAKISVPFDNTTESIGPFSFEVKGRLVYDPRENRLLNANDFSSAAGWQGSFDVPAVTTGQVDPFAGTAATLLEWTGAGDHNWFKGATAVAPGNYVNAAIWLRGAPGAAPLLVRWQAYNTGPPLEASYLDILVTADRWVGPIDATQLCTVAGIATCGVYISAVTSPKLLVYGAHVALKSYYGGRCITTGAAILPVTAWSRNLPLVLLDILTGGPAANPHSARIPFTTSKFLFGSFGDAATIAGRDEGAGDIRWGIDIVFNQPGQGVAQALARARAVAPCDVYRQDDLWRCDIEHEFGAAQIDFDTKTNTYPQDLGWEIPPRQDRPSRVRLAFADPDKQWVADSAVYPPPDETITELDETSLSLDASASRRQMVQFAAYIFRVGKMKRCQLRGTPAAALAHRYQRVSFTSGVNAIPTRQAVVIGLGLNEGGLEWTAQLRETDPSLFTAVDPGDPGSGGIPSPLTIVTPVVQPRFDDAATFLMGVSPARDYEARTLYPAASWAQANVTGWDADKIDDGILTVSAGDFTAAADTIIRLDAGSDIDFCAARIALAVDSIPAGWLFEMSPDDAAWTAVNNPFKRPNEETSGFWGEWDLTTAQRYIRLRKGSSVVGAEVIRELQFFDFKGIYPNSDYVRVEDEAGSLRGTFPARFARQDVNMTPYAVTTVATDGTIVKTVDVWLVNVNGKGQRSIRVRVTHVINAASLDPPVQVRMVRVSHEDHTARWQLGCVYDAEARYGAERWTVYNAVAIDKTRINDGDGALVALNMNAPGTTMIEVDITDVPEKFCGVDITIPAGTSWFGPRLTTAPEANPRYTNQPSQTGVLGPIEQLRVEYFDPLLGVYVRPFQTLKTSSTVVNYAGRAAVADGPVPASAWDLYTVTSGQVRIEWDPQLITTTKPRWRVVQATSGAAAAVDLNVLEVNWLKFVRWNLIEGFGLWAGLVNNSSGVSQTVDGGVVDPTGGKSTMLVPFQRADPTTGNVDYSFTSPRFAAGVAGGRRAAWPGADAAINALGWLDEVTIIPYGLAPALTQGQARFAWDYSPSKGENDSPLPPRLMRFNSGANELSWQQPVVYADPTLFPASAWTAINTSVFDAALANNGDLTVVAANPNAAGATDITLGLAGAGRVFWGVRVTFREDTRLVSEVVALAGSAAIDRFDKFVLQYRAVAGSGAWITPTQAMRPFTAAEAGLVSVAYTRISSTQSAWPDKSKDIYNPIARGVDIEIDGRTVPGAPEEWQLHQTTATAIDVNISEIQPLVFSRWNTVVSYDIWAGFDNLTNGAESFRENVPAVGTDYTLAGAFSAFGRRAPHPCALNYFRDTNGNADPPPLVSGNVLGLLYEATVRSVGSGASPVSSKPAFGWLYTDSTEVGLAL